MRWSETDPKSWAITTPNDSFYAMPALNGPLATVARDLTKFNEEMQAATGITMREDKR